MRIFLFFIIISSITFSCQKKKVSTNYGILIKNAKIIDGTGEEAYYAHLLINADTIALIDRDTSRSYLASITINGNGLTLTPGFIDTHAHGDPMATPEFKNFLAMGATTICLGQDGFSPPYLEIDEWLDSLSSINPAVNIATFVGHGSLRKASGLEYKINPTEEDLMIMEEKLRNALESGAFGMTLGLEYVPGLHAKEKELLLLAKLIGNHGGLIMVHLRSEEDRHIEKSINELLKIGEYCPVHISHLKIISAKSETRANRVLEMLADARKNVIRITADVYPYNAAYSTIGIIFPEWTLPPYNYEEVVGNRKEELELYLRKKVLQRNGPESILISSGEFSGKTLQEVSEELNKSFEKVLVEDLGPEGAYAAFFIMNSSVQDVFIKDNSVMICTDGGVDIPHPRSYGAFAKIIQKYVVEEEVLTLPNAIRKMTGLPAETLGIKDRGFIREGYKADLLLFDPANIAAHATYQDPFQLASGLKTVFVNGQIAKQDGKFSVDRHGVVLKKQMGYF
jgi:N-acyl-D-amino-acid deacylase